MRITITDLLHTTPVLTLLQTATVRTMMLHIQHGPECITTPPGTRDIMAAIGTGATGMRETGAVTEGVSKTARAAIMTGIVMMAGTVMPAGITVTATDTCPDWVIKYPDS